jgi:hypothetical protein
MRATFVPVAAMMVVAAATPTFAAKRHHLSTPTFGSARQDQPTPGFDTCEALSVERGSSSSQGGNSLNPYTQYNAFMKQCLAGQIPLEK